MEEKSLPLDTILHGNCLQLLETLPEKSINLVFADPPYNLQLRNALWRPNLTRVEAVDDEWDRFESFADYDQFTRAWLNACRRVLKDDGSLWVIGTYHNIYRVGAILQDLGFWILNDITWIKTNPMPNFRGVRFTNAHETLLWASKFKGARYTFNHHAMKAMNEEKQMRSDWRIPLCTGPERLKRAGKRAHSTQKPEALLYRVLLSSSNPGDVVLDPFFGTGTTGAVAKKMNRYWIGIEIEADYVALAQQRIDETAAEPLEECEHHGRDEKRSRPRVAFTRLVKERLLQPGESLYFRAEPDLAACITADGRLALDGLEGSIHSLGRQMLNGKPCNGWLCWYYLSDGGELQPIDTLREAIRQKMDHNEEETKS